MANVWITTVENFAMQSVIPIVVATTFQENFLPGEGGSARGSFDSTLNLSRLSRDKRRKSCLLAQVTWLSAKPSLSAGGGGGSVILVTRYAVDACATPYIRTPMYGTRKATVKAKAKPKSTPSRSRNHRRFCSGVNRTREKYGSS